MEKSKLVKQIMTIFLIILMFAAFEASIYNIFTKKYINNTSEQMQAKSIELDKYLPFEEESQVAKIDSELLLEGELPVVDGAAALYPVFSGFVNAVYPQDSVEYADGNFTADSVLQFNNTRGAYKNVVDKTADIVFCAKPSQEQLDYAKEKGVELELVPIGLDGFVFIVNVENPVDGLTVEQIKDIYSMKCTNWNQVGGDNSLINAISRNEGSGSQTAMISFMDGEEIKRNPLAFCGRSIGFSFRYYVSDIVENGGVKMLSVDGVYPNKENIQNKTYPLTDCFYAVYRKDNDNPNIPIFVDWIKSEEGQEIVEKSGYVPYY